MRIGLPQVPRPDLIVFGNFDRCGHPVSRVRDFQSEVVPTGSGEKSLFNSGFAPGGGTTMILAMDNPAQAIEAARRAGIDLDLLDSNLALSVKERWRLHDEALNLAMKLREAAERRDAKLQSTAATAR